MFIIEAKKCISGYMLEGKDWFRFVSPLKGLKFVIINKDIFYIGRTTYKINMVQITGGA